MLNKNKINNERKYVLFIIEKLIIFDLLYFKIKNIYGLIWCFKKCNFILNRIYFQNQYFYLLLYLDYLL